MSTDDVMTQGDEIQSELAQKALVRYLLIQIQSTKPPLNSLVSESFTLKKHLTVLL